MELRPHGLTAALWPNGIRSLIRKTRFLPVLSFQCSTPVGNTRRQPKSCFGENQLLRNSISFSLLTTSHPMVLYGQPVRASTTYYSRFTLLMASSSRFGSYPYPRTEQHRHHKICNVYFVSHRRHKIFGYSSVFGLTEQKFSSSCHTVASHKNFAPLDCDVYVVQFVRAIHARFHYASVGLPLRQRIKVHSPAHSSIGTPSPRRAPTPCRCMVSDLFHSPLRGSFHLSLTVLVHYRSPRIFSLTS